MRIKKQIVSTFLLLLTLVTIIDVFCVSSLLPVYCYSRKQKAMEEIAQSVNDHLASLNSADYLSWLQKTCRQQGVGIGIYDQQAQQVAAFYAFDHPALLPAEEKMMYASALEILQTSQDTLSSEKRMEGRLRLENGFYLLMVSGLEPMGESAAYSGVFLVSVVLFVGPLACILLLWLASRISRPLVLLADQMETFGQTGRKTSFKPGGSYEMQVLGREFERMQTKLAATLEDLEKTIRQKEKMEAARKSFLAAASHELKTPIAVINGFADLIVDEPASPQVVEYASKICEQSESMMALVKQLLAQCRMEEMKDQTVKKAVDLKAQAEFVQKQIEPVLQAKNARIEGNIFEHPWVVLSDADVLSHVFGNYLTNAADYVCADGRISVDIRRTEEKWRLEVYNQGPQIAEDHLASIWDKFYKIDQARKRTFGGTGLGLSIVQSCAQTLNESCGACNVQDGVVFFFTIPDPEESSEQMSLK